MDQMHQDIRIVSLYKQHYFDYYIDPEMNNQYSCLGYYDGIGISRIPESDPDPKSCSDLSKRNSYSSELFEKKSHACLSRVWAGTARETATMNGKYSKQIIGIFRCINPDAEQMQVEYNDVENHSPYFLLLFLQAKKHTDYEKLEKSIYELSEYPRDMMNPYISFAVYHTYDNADLVVLAYSNSMRKIGAKLSSIRSLPNVCYLHPMIGISEDYLRDCQSTGTLYILPKWYGRSCFVDERLAHLTMKIASARASGIQERILGKLNRLKTLYGIKITGYHNIVFSTGTGHGSLRMDITDTDVKSLVALLSGDGMLIHKNKNFGTYIYNIETYLYWDSKSVSDIIPDVAEEESDCDTAGKNNAKDRKKDPAPCFSDLAKIYGQKAQDEWERPGIHDEGLFSYYCALSQVYDTLAQYEGFSLARDIFSLLYPAVQMFEHLLGIADAALANDNPSSDIRERRNDSICEFVNAVNSVVYHTIHTDQIFLMIPGYSGSTYSIPVKLCLMYSWVIGKVISILNDAEYKYACLLTPELETRPVTTLINMGMFEDDRLIRFSSSQRSLYMPRHFIILITHELAHYVGKSVRNRNLRLVCISKALAFLLAEGIFPEHYCIQEDQSPVTVKDKLLLLMRKSVVDKMEENCLNPILDKVNENSSSRKEHATEIIPKFKEVCYELLEEKGIIHNCIYTFPNDLEHEFNREDMPEIINMVREIQNQMDRNRRILISSQSILDTCISELVQLFREVFSDLAALAILEYDQQTFSEVFNVSEGIVSKTGGDVQRSAREWVVQNILEASDIQSDISEEADSKEKDSYIPDEWPRSLTTELFTYVRIGEYLKDYADACYKALKAQVKIHKDEQKEVRRVYKMFSSDEASCSEIYCHIVNKIDDYNRSIYTQKEKNE